jgi:hypothetical protein
MSDITPRNGENPRRFIVGRARELEQFAAAFDRMLAGRRQ